MPPTTASADAPKDFWVYRSAYLGRPPTHVDKIWIHASVIKILDNTFTDLKQVVEVRFDQNCQLQTIGEYAFSGTSISTITIPATVKEIGDYAFSRCKLEDIDFNSDNCQLEKIGKYAFDKTSISTIEIPRSVEEIGGYAFRQCSKLTIVKFSLEYCQLVKIGMFAFSETSISAIIFPNAVKEIGRSAFYQCQKLTDANFLENSNIEKIGIHAFSETSISTIAIPDSVQQLGLFSFSSERHERPPTEFSVLSSSISTLNSTDHFPIDESVSFFSTSTPTNAIPDSAKETERVSNGKRTQEESRAHEAEETADINPAGGFKTDAEEPANKQRKVAGNHHVGNNESKKPAADCSINEPKQHDVISGRGGHGNIHLGNKQWKWLTKQQEERYFNCKTHEKKEISLFIVVQVKENGGRFLKKKNGKYYEISDEEATSKTSQLFRDQQDKGPSKLPEIRDPSLDALQYHAAVETPTFGIDNCSELPPLGFDDSWI